MSLFFFFFFFFFFLAAFRGDEKLNPPMAELKVPCEIRYYASACRPSSQCAIGFQRHKEYLLIGSNLIRVQAESTESIPFDHARSFFTQYFPLRNPVYEVGSSLCFRSIVSHKSVVLIKQ